MLILGIAACLFPFQSGPALADCANGDGAVTSQGICTVPQTLSGPTGAVVSGATLATGLGATAYTVSSSRATITNSGTVSSQGPQAFLVSGSTATGSTITLINNGSITATSGNAIVIDPNAIGTTLNIVNTGYINGSILNARGRSGGTITQAGGTIQGGVFMSGFASMLLVSGGAINGPLQDITPASGAAGSSQGRGMSVSFDLGGGQFTTNGGINVNSLNVQSGTVVLQNDVYASNAVTNNSVLQISGLRTITGNFVQTPSGTLVMQVSPQDSSQLKINHLPFFGGGTASLAGTLALAYQPGTYQPRSYTLISTDTSNLIPTSQSITGSFSNVTGTVPTPGLTQTITMAPNEVDLVLRGVVSPSNTTIFPAMTTAIVMNGQQINGILLDRLGSRRGGIADGPIVGTGVAATPQLAANSNLAAIGQIAQALPDALAAQGAWFRGLGRFASLNGNGTAPGFTATQGGFLAGLDQAVTPNVYLGLAGGYQRSDVHEHSTSNGTIDAARVSVYGGGWWGPNLLTATAGYAHDWIASTRGLSVGTARQSHGGDEVTAVGQWSIPMQVMGLRGSATVTPKAGIQFLHLSESSFAESGATGFNLSSSGSGTDSVQPYVGLAAAETFLTADGADITPEMRLGYAHEVADNGRVLTVAALDGTSFLVNGVRPSRDMVAAGGGVTLRADPNTVLYANYDAVLHTGNTSDQIVSAGIRIRF